MRKGLLACICVVILLAACGGKKANVEVNPVPKPSHVILEIEASGDINPNVEGHPSPVVLRIYELKSLSGFGKADFVSLYEKDKEVLGGDLIRRQEIMVQPNEKKTVHIEASPEARAIGAFAGFRRYEQARWRGSVSVRPGETIVLPVTIRGNNLQMP